MITVNGIFNYTGKPGYTGSDCESECSEWQYGQGCDNQCTCVVENTVDCDHVDGLCNCKPGFEGSDCESECGPTNYGQDCENICTCVMENTVDCDHVDGTCVCKPGYEGSDCESECSDWQYGQGCDNQCSCVVENTADCDHVDGTCTCHPGFSGSDCEIVPTPAPELCNGEQFYFPDLENRCKFYQCDKFGAIFNMPCEYGLIWNQTELDCVPPPNGIYDCGGAPLPETAPTKKPWTGTVPTQGPTQPYPPGPYPPVCGGSRFYYPDIENKCKFWQCDRFNRIFHMPCAYGLVWNQTEKDCVWPVGEYECGEADPEPITVIEKCKTAKVDLVFVLDSSGSVTAKNFEKVKGFVKDFLKDADIDNDAVRVGVNVYSSLSTVSFNLNTYSSKD